MVSTTEIMSRYGKSPNSGQKQRVQEAETGRVLVPPESETVPDVSVVLPTLNEERGVAICIERIVTALTELGMTGEIIVSDSSTDRTTEIAREKEAQIVTPDREGYGYAYRYAFARTRGNFIVIGDADATYDFEELPKLLECLNETGADIVMGNRLKGTIRSGAMPPLHQYVGNPLLTGFLNAFYDAGVSDAHSGFRVLTREALDKLHLRTTGMEFASEMIMDACAKDLVIEEVPITYHEREGEATIESFRDGWRHVRFILTNAPEYLFTAPAILLGVMGLLLMVVSFLNSRINGIFFGTHTVIAASLFTILSYQIGSLGVFSAVATNPIRSPQDPMTVWIREHFRLEYGATLGTTVLLVGSLFAGLLLWNWLRSGLADPPFVVSLMVAFTAVVLGIQTVFYSFFLSTLGSQRNT